MTEKPEEFSENTQTPTKKEEDIHEKTKAEEDNTQPKAEMPGETPEPKARGRPKGTKDTKPRVKRIPIITPEQEAPKANPKKVQVREEPEQEEDESPQAEAPLPEPFKIKSPCAQRPERMQAFSAKRHAETMARQGRLDALIDNFMGY